MILGTLIPAAIEKITWTITPEVEARVRYEYRTDKDFNDTKNDNRADLPYRIRPGVKWTYGKKWSGQLQFQYASTASWTQKGNSSVESSDLFQAYVTYKPGKASLTLGRQKLTFGTGRLFGSPDWGNTGRPYDALRYHDQNWDVFGASVAIQVPRPRFARYAGASYKSELGTTALIYKHDSNGSSGDLDHYTLTHHAERDWKGVAFDFEGALQFGRAWGKDQQAWAFHLQAAKQFGKSTKAYAEWNAASGGSTPGKSYTFDNLTPSNHPFYGSMDMQGWRNTDMFVLGLSQTVNKKLSLSSRLSWNSLRDASDAWYAGSGAINKTGSTLFIDPTGSSGRFLGNEFDLEFNYNVQKGHSFAGGVGVFAPGTFVKNVSGSARNQVWTYLQYSAKF